MQIPQLMTSHRITSFEKFSRKNGTDFMWPYTKVMIRWGLGQTLDILYIYFNRSPDVKIIHFV